MISKINEFTEYINSKPENDYFCCIIRKFSFHVYLNDNLSIEEMQQAQIKPKIIVIDTFFEEQYKKYLYMACIDFKFFIFLENDFINYISFFSKNADSLYISKTIIEGHFSSITELNKKKSAVLFEKEIPEFWRFIKCKYIKEISKKKFPLQIWSIIHNCILGTLIRRAYLNSRFDRVLYYKEFFNPEISDTIIPNNNHKYLELRKFGGSNSTVSLNYDLMQEMVFILKINNSNDLYNIEFEFFKEFHHPLLPRLLTSNKDKNLLYVEYLDGETLDELIKKGNISREMKIKIIFEILIIINYIHSKGYIYCDLKTNNIIVNKNYTTYLIDFNSMIKQDQQLQGFLGAGKFIAPEIANGFPCVSNKADIFSIGKIIKNLFSSEINNEENIKLKEIMNRCIELYPQKRPNISELTNIFYELCFSQITEISEIDTIKSIKDIYSEKFIPYWLFVAEYENPVAQYNLGEIYERGELLPKDINKAIQYYLLSCYQKYEKSEEKLKKIFNDEFVLNDVNKMMKYSFKYQKIFEQFICEDQNQTCILYTSQINKLIKLLLGLVKQNNSESQYVLGNIYYKGRHIPGFIQKSIYYFTLAAKENHKKALYKLGYIYYEGFYVHKNIERSIHYLQVASNFQSPKAQYLLGFIYYDGKYVNKNLNKSIIFLSLAAYQNHLESQYLLGSILYEIGNSEDNIRKSIYCLSQAAEKYHSKAQYLLGIIYYEGKHVYQDIDESIKYFIQAAKNNHNEAQFLLGKFYYEGKYVDQNIDESIKYLILAAEHNHHSAQYLLGYIYYEGKYVDQNIDKSIKYLTLAAEHNHNEAQYLLGKIYYEGKYVDQNIDESIKYFIQAAQNNHIEAQFLLGKFYYEGEYVDQNIDELIKYFIQAAKNNHNEAQFLLGKFYYEGKYVDQNIDESIKYLTLAAEHNHHEAQYLLGVIYYKENYAHQNINMSIKYFILAAQNNHQKAQHHLISIFLKIIINHLIFDHEEKPLKNNDNQIKINEKREENRNLKDEKYKQNNNVKEFVEEITEAINNIKKDNMKTNIRNLLSEINDFFYECIDKIIETQEDSSKVNNLNNSNTKKSKIKLLLGKYLLKLKQYNIEIQNYLSSKDISDIKELIPEIKNMGSLLEKLIAFLENDCFDFVISENDCFDFFISENIEKIKVVIDHERYWNEFTEYIIPNIKEDILARMLDMELMDILLNIFSNNINDIITHNRDNCNTYFSQFIFNLIQEANNNNNPEAQFFLGVIYYEGRYIERNIDKSILYLSQAARNYHSDALYLLGKIYYEGHVVERDINKSIIYLSQAANQNHSESLYFLGLIYFEGTCIQRDIRKTISYFSRAAYLNHSDAQYRLGIIYSEGKNIAKDIEIALSYFSQAAERNHLEAQYQLGMIYLHGDDKFKNVEKAIDYLFRAAERNHLEAQYQLGMIYLHGEDNVRNVERGINYLFRAAEQNHLEAQYQLGMIYLHGEDNIRNVERGIYYLLLAAEQNHLEAQYQLGMIYLHGEDRFRNTEMAIHFLTEAAGQNHPKAMLQLGLLYSDENSMYHDPEIALYYFYLSLQRNYRLEAIHMIELIRARIDYYDFQYQLGIFFYEHINIPGFANKAFSYFSQAADHHHRKAQYMLGVIYVEGQIVPQNITNAIFYLSLASNHNLREAHYKLGIIYLEGRYFMPDVNRSIYYIYRASQQQYLLATHKLIFLSTTNFPFYFNNNIRSINEIMKFYIWKWNFLID